jgi:hypothetical protein
MNHTVQAVEYELTADNNLSEVATLMCLAFMVSPEMLANSCAW